LEWCGVVEHKALPRPVGNSAAESVDPQSPVRGLQRALQ
jgi:hypothetical protein